MNANIAENSRKMKTGKIFHFMKINKLQNYSVCCAKWWYGNSLITLVVLNLTKKEGKRETGIKCVILTKTAFRRNQHNS